MGATGPATGTDARRLLKVVEDFSGELAGGRKLPAVTADSRLDRDLGLDSLALAGLLLRVEREFDVSLPEDALNAGTPAALLRFLRASRRRSSPVPDERPFTEPAPVGGLPDTAATLPGMLDWHAARHPDRVHAYLYTEDGHARPLSYAELQHGSDSVAAGLAALGVRRDDRVALMLPTGRDYFCAFLGILCAGAVPVPIYPPGRASQIAEHMRRHGRILANAGARLLLTVATGERIARLLRAEAPGLERILTVDAVRAAAAGPAERAAAASGDLALLQYTSGSTGDPKGVMLTHANLLANIRAMGQRLEVCPDDVFVSWLPLYHDMGLIGAWLGSLYYAVPLAAMSPLRFLARPLEWLRAIHRHRATISGGPNFGYELCLRALEAGVPSGLDLSCWRVAFNGAEPVNPATLESFASALAPAGFRRSALMPVYGLAEASVGLTLPAPGAGPEIDRVDRDRFLRRRFARPAAPGDPSPLLVAGCGPPLPGSEVRALGPDGRECPERQEGELEFRSPSATPGYYRNPEATQALFHDGWLVTGDRGYVAGGTVFVTGRSKDVIVRGGRNIYPYELEEAVGRLPGVRRGCVAVFGTGGGEPGVERLVIAAEIRANRDDVRDALRARIRDVSAAVAGIPADAVCLLPPHAVLKTSSGKIRRGAMAELYRRGRLGRRDAALWWQILRLVLGGAYRRAGLAASRLASAAYAGWAWMVLGIAAALAWPAVMLLPEPGWRWASVRVAAALAGRLTGVAVEVRGRGHLPPGGDWVLVSNHASYVDALVLARAIPRRMRYLAKRELAGRPLVGALLRRLDVLFVERFERGAAAADAARIAEAVAAGDPVACFAEGTFERDPGLRPFHMGAFVAAARAGVPVVPVALQGTRSLMRGSEWYPRRGRARVIIGEPIAPDGRDWRAAVRLRERARAVVLASCGEGDAAGPARGAGPT
ncbi:MAG TPA: AMP-binding protein [Gammaproteobacteria bacterium]|nr:AMP-binding protein [Gammaproteobacteria bacterium]